MCGASGKSRDTSENKADMEIYPAILAHSEEEFIMKVEHVRALNLPLHVDVMDGEFVDNTTWADPERMRDIMHGLEYEVHLMVHDPENVIDAWCKAGAARIFFHGEAEGDLGKVAERMHEGCHVGLAINPETEVAKVAHLIERTHLCLVMSVNPGWSGQEFQTEALQKIKLLKAMRSQMDVRVDGGINLDIITEVKEAGASAAVMGSGLTDTNDVMGAWIEIQKRNR